MKEFKIACFITLIILGTASLAVWTVRPYLPIIGFLLLVVLVVGMLLALAYIVERLHRR